MVGCSACNNVSLELIYPLGLVDHIREHNQQRGFEIRRRLVGMSDKSGGSLCVYLLHHVLDQSQIVLLEWLNGIKWRRPTRFVDLITISSLVQVKSGTGRGRFLAKKSF
jgi:hypothetical protein